MILTKGHFVEKKLLVGLFQNSFIETPCRSVTVLALSLFFMDFHLCLLFHFKKGGDVVIVQGVPKVRSSNFIH